MEELEDSAPPEWYTGGTYAGAYIRGLKPDGLTGNPVFEADALRCTGAAGRRFGSAPAAAVALAALVARAAVSLVSVPAAW